MNIAMPHISILTKDGLWHFILPISGKQISSFCYENDMSIFKILKICLIL